MSDKKTRTEAITGADPVNELNRQMARLRFLNQVICEAENPVLDGLAVFLEDTLNAYDLAIPILLKMPAQAAR